MVDEPFETGLHQRLDAFDLRFDAIEDRLDAFDHRFDAGEHRLTSAIQLGLDGVRRDMATQGRTLAFGLGAATSTGALVLIASQLS